MSAISAEKVHISDRFWLAMLVILVLALGKSFYSQGIGLEQRWSGDTTDTFYRVVTTTSEADRVVKGSLVGRIVRDQANIISTQPIHVWYQLSFENYLRAVYVETGDITQAYKLLVFPLNLLFLLGAYVLFRHVGCRSRWALLIAVVASMDIYIPWVAEKMGLGPVWTYTRRYLYTAFVPWLVFAYLYYFNRKVALGIVMLAAGVIANLHSSGLLLIGIFLLVWLSWHGRKLENWGITGLYAGGAALGAFYALGSIWGRLFSQVLTILLGMLMSSATAATFFPALLEGKTLLAQYIQFMTYPPREYKNLPLLVIDFWVICTLLATLAPMLVRRYRPEYLSLSLMLAASACLLFTSFEAFSLWVALAIVLYLRAKNSVLESRYFEISCRLIVVTFWLAVPTLMFWQFMLTQVPNMPLGLEQVRALRFEGFFVFLWLASITAATSKAKPGKYRWYPVLLYSVLVVILLTQGRDIYKRHVRWLERSEYKNEVALLDLARWGKTNLPNNAHVFVGSSTFGVVSERRVSHTDKTAQFPGSPALAPLQHVSPEYAAEQREKYSATHAVVDTALIVPKTTECVLAKNERYALIDLACPALASVAKPVEPLN